MIEPKDAMLFSIGIMGSNLIGLLFARGLVKEVINSFGNIVVVRGVVVELCIAIIPEPRLLVAGCPFELLM